MSELIAAPLAYAPLALPAGFGPSSTIQILRLASAGYTTDADDDPAHTVYQPRLYGDIEVSQSAVDAFGIGGRVALGLAQIEVADADGYFTDPITYGTADGRRCTVRVVPVLNTREGNFGSPLGSSAIAFDGILQRIDASGGLRARLTITDASERLAVKLQPTLFAGTGGLEGPTTLAGRPKPVTLGRIRNVTPVSIGNVDLGDGSLPTYVVHSAAVQDITAVRIRGVAQTLVGTAPTVGEARVWVDSGAFQLGSSPDGIVTADVEGDASSGTVASTAGILKIMLQQFGPLLTDAQIATPAFDQAETDLPGDVGFYQGADEISTAAAVDRILAGCGAILAGGRDGRIRLVDPLAQGEAQFTLDVGRILSLEPADMPAALRPTPWAVAVDWSPNATAMTDFAGSVTDDDRASLAAAALGPARSESATVSARVAQQREWRVPGLYVDEADALTRGGQWRDFFEAAPRMFRLTTDRYLGQVEVGDIGAIAYPAYGLDAGRGVVVVAVQEALSARRLTLTVCTVPWVTYPAVTADVFFVLDQDLLA